ncbi:Leucine Rich repeats (2 copies) [Gimesia panareensis]|uniref:Leucine Rich repeats (2 copies) n=1 Tax=Gimesia panareensis TaxID=2527978 RepID=A0A518FMZ4_9PLAN|nr:hypothetical protein [Gimesia panareensis]QDV17724.1 Leucine Rich repeats (2 copies) [Gimesia panareensis]
MRFFSVALLTTLSLTQIAVVSAADKKKDPAVEQAKSKVRAAGGSVLELAQNDDRLEVAFHLSDQKVTDETLKSLAGLSKVASLNLRGTDVTSAGLAHLKNLKDLTHLHLEKTKVDDAGMKQLQALPNLEYLNLYGTAVTDAGVAQLGSLKKLKRLYVWQTKVTRPAGLALQEQISGLEVIGIPEPPKPVVAEKPEVPKPAEKKPAEKKPEPKKPEPKKEEKKK